MRMMQNLKVEKTAEQYDLSIEIGAGPDKQIVAVIAVISGNAQNKRVSIGKPGNVDFRGGGWEFSFQNSKPEIVKAIALLLDKASELADKKK